MSGYYVQTDILKPDSFTGNHVWVTEEEEQDALRSKDTPMSYIVGGERFYWNGETKTMDGAVERATAYPTVAEAESQAFIASCLDPNLAGHVHIIAEADALKLEKGRIEARKREAAQYKAHMENRFKLGNKEGLI
jgi:hypothetical protein